MADITRRVLVLNFTNTIGKTVSLTVTSPIEGASSEIVSSVMDEIIATGAYGDENIVANKVDAKYVIQQEEPIELA